MVVISTCALSIAIVLSAVATANAAYPMALDPTFGSGGTLLTPIGQAIDANDAQANALALQSDGKLVAAGYAKQGRSDKLAVARYNPDGSLDTTFGDHPANDPSTRTGVVLTGVTPAIADGAKDHIQSLVVQSDGKLVAAGYAAVAGTGDYFVLARYNADGTRDATLNPSAPADCPGTLINVACQGVVTIEPGGRVSRARSVIVQPDGKYVLGGLAKVNATTGATTQFALVRFNADGTVDTSFGASGKVMTPVGNGGVAGINALVLQTDGKIVAAGTALDGGLEKFALARFNADGTLDTTFGAGGKTLTSVGSDDAELNSLTVDHIGRLVAAGSAFANDSSVFGLARYSANGVLDTNFYNRSDLSTPHGTVVSPIGGDGGAIAYSITTHGRQLLVGGVASDGGVAQLALAMYNARGEPDTSFSPTGSVLVPAGNGGYASGAAVVSDLGRPVVAGYASNDGANDFALARLVPTPPASSPGSPGPTPSSCFQRFTAVICPGSPVPSSVKGSCRVQSSSARMSRSGRIKLRLTCTGAARGTLALKAKKLTVGRASFSVKKATSMTVNVKLSKKARRRITSGKRLSVRATVSDQGAGTSATSKNLTIKAPKKKARKKR